MKKERVDEVMYMSSSCVSEAMTQFLGVYYPVTMPYREIGK